MRRPRGPFSGAVVVLAGAVLFALGAGSCRLDEAALVDPGASFITAEPGQLRVLRYRTDPDAGDDWIDVLPPDPSVVVETGTFRERDARLAEPDVEADVRRLFEAVAPGRTVLVELNCAGCAGGVPTEVSADGRGLHVWDFRVGDDFDTAPVLGPSAAVEGRINRRRVGDHVVVVRPRSPEPVRPVRVDDDVLTLVATTGPGGAGDLVVDVFVAVGPGRHDLVYDYETGPAAYPITVGP